MTSVGLDVVLAISKEFCKAASLQGEMLHGTMMVARQPSPRLVNTWRLSETCRPAAPSYWQPFLTVSGALSTLTKSTAEVDVAPQ